MGTNWKCQINIVNTVNGYFDYGPDHVWNIDRKWTIQSRARGYEAGKIVPIHFGHMYMIWSGLISI